MGLAGAEIRRAKLRFGLLTGAVSLLVFLVLLLGLNRVASLWVMVGIVIAVACTLMFMQATGVTLNLIPCSAS